jgi:vesicle-associated membrane protein 72
MPLIYSAVARGPVLLSEYSVFAGNFSTVAKTYLSKSTNDGRFAYTVDSHVFSFLAEDGYCEWTVAVAVLLYQRHSLHFQHCTS